jgi:cleavage and polyadenylation specificity factor subunit 3
LIAKDSEAKLHFVALGETNRIGASALYLRLDKWGILLDAGIDPHSTGDNGLPNYDLIKDLPLNAIIISHAHLDHLGSLPVALQYFPFARVYMTPATAALSEKLLFIYHKIQERRAAENRIKYHPLYTVEQLENILYLFQSFDYNFPFKIHGFGESDIEITFWDAGHILGSAGIEIRWRGRSIFYTGNTKKSKQFILKGASYPKNADTLIMETTYGGDSQASSIKQSEEIKRFVHFLKEKIRMGGAVLIPVFALGRTQEILYLLYRLIQKNHLPAVPIYISGLGKAINRIYDRLLHKTYPDFNTKKLSSISTDTLQNKHYRKPSILLATSGMMIPDTLSYEITFDFLNERRNGIAFVGWADPEMPGGALREVNIEKIQDIFGIDHIICDIKVFKFSAHSHRQELLSLVRQINPQKVVLCHGDSSGLNWIMQKIKGERNTPKIFMPECCEFIIL